MRAVPAHLRDRSLAFAILFALVLGLWFAILQPVVTAFGDRDEAIDDGLALLSAYQASTASRPAIEVRFQQLQARGGSVSGLLPGNSPALAAAQIQSDLRTIIESNGGQMRSTQNLPASKVEDFEKIDIGCDFSLPVRKLKDVVYQIETRTPYLFIDKVDIRAPENWQPGPEGAQMPNLEVHWIVSGYRWVGTKSP